MAPSRPYPFECATGRSVRGPAGCYRRVTALDSAGMPFPSSPKERDRPWVMRTYAGHSSPAESNALYRRNLAKGQTGLSVAFDLPTQTGYDPDDELAVGEVGKVGVPVTHIGDMRALFDGIPLDEMNTSMTINATAMWLLALYQAVAEEHGHDVTKLAGTTQNDIIKEYLSRGTYVFPPAPSMRLITDMVAYTVTTMPKWNPINICSYHLQEAGATPVQEIAYAISTAIAVLDSVRDSGQVPQEKFGEVVARISFFVNAGVRFVEEMCKMRAFTQLWDELTQERYGVEDPKHRRFRYGVQVNSLGPDRGAAGEQRPADRAGDARRHAVPRRPRPRGAAAGLERGARPAAAVGPAVVAAPAAGARLRDRPARVRGPVHRLGRRRAEGRRARRGRPGRDRPRAGDGRRGRGRRVRLHEERELVGSLAERRRRIESGEDVVVGVNRFESTEPNPLTADLDAAIMTVDPAVESAAQEAVQKWRAERDQEAADKALDALREAAGTDDNLMAATLDCARAGVTTGEWAGVLREVFGEYRAPTGVAAASGGGEADATLTDVRERVRATGEELGGRLRFLVGKPGLDGHSNGAEQIAVRARDAGFEVDLPGHPAHPGADRLGRGRGGRARRRAVGAVRLAPAGRAGGARRACRRPGWTTSRSWSAGSSPTATPAGCASRAWPGSSRRRTSG